MLRHECERGDCEFPALTADVNASAPLRGVTTLCDYRGDGDGSRCLMGDKSAIEWTEATWNPTTGCDRTSPGCDHCYALALAKRLKAMGVHKYQHDGDPRTSGPGFGVTLHPEALALPYRWARPRVVFVNSMSDLFHDTVPLDFIRQVFAVMAETPQHTYQVLTKRARRLARVAEDLPWPANVWMGVSVESDRYSFRANHLRAVPAAVRFVSVEPMLGPVPKLDLADIHWVIAGGESGPGAVRCEWSGWSICKSGAGLNGSPSSSSSGAVVRRRPAGASSADERGTRCRWSTVARLRDRLGWLLDESEARGAPQVP